LSERIDDDLGNLRNGSLLSWSRVKEHKMTAKKKRPRENPLCTAIRKRMRELQNEIAWAERQGEKERVYVLLWEKQDLTKRLMGITPTPLEKTK
jgi:hypothetical protein